jgi:3-phenylpropionate/cinnamic acid dioxygenase small subunit
MTRPARAAAPIAGDHLAPVAGGPLATAAVHAELTLALALEAEALDDRDFGGWQAMVDDAFTYRVPVPLVRDNPFGPPYDPAALLIDETKESIVDIWFQRLAPGAYEVAWGDHPPARQRHFVSGVRVRHTDAENVVLVRSNVRLVIVRQATRPGELTAERFDHWRRVPEGGWRLRERFAVLDAALITAPMIRVLL